MQLRHRAFQPLLRELEEGHCRNRRSHRQLALSPVTTPTGSACLGCNSRARKPRGRTFNEAAPHARLSASARTVARPSPPKQWQASALSTRQVDAGDSLASAQRPAHGLEYGRGVECLPQAICYNYNKYGTVTARAQRRRPHALWSALAVRAMSLTICGQLARRRCLGAPSGSHIAISRRR